MKLLTTLWIKTLNAVRTIIQKIMAKVNLDIAPRLDITCKKGDTFKIVIDFQTELPSAISCYDMKVAEDSESTPVPLTFDYSIASGAVLNSELTITSSAATTADITAGLYVYDIQVTDHDEEVFDAVGGASYEKTLLYGTFRVNDDVNVT
jgi:hypothetical protein